MITDQEEYIPEDNQWLQAPQQEIRTLLADHGLPTWASTAAHRAAFS